MTKIRGNASGGGEYKATVITLQLWDWSTTVDFEVEL